MCKHKVDNIPYANGIFVLCSAVLDNLFVISKQKINQIKTFAAGIF